MPVSSPLKRTRAPSYPVRGVFPILLLVSLAQCTTVPDPLVVHHQVTMPGQTKTYLLYDPGSREAALFDVGGPMDSLAAFIESEGLEVKYIFTTHGHQDHVAGMTAAMERYPQAEWGISREEFEDFAFDSGMGVGTDEAVPEETAAQLRALAEQDPAVAEMFAFDFGLLGQPDIFLKDGEVLPLGNQEIRTFLSPGHSRGSICFHAGDMLFSGDVLFQGSVGRTDFPRSGGTEAISASVRRLYDLLPAGTRVFPGHGPPTSIGAEMENNTGFGLGGGGT